MRGLKLDDEPCLPTSVILGLDPRIHDFNDLWMVGSSPTMTKREVSDLCPQSEGRASCAAFSVSPRPHP